MKESRKHACIQKLQTAVNRRVDWSQNESIVRAATVMRLNQFSHPSGRSVGGVSELIGSRHDGVSIARAEVTYNARTGKMFKRTHVILAH